MKLVTVEQMRAIEQETDAAGVSYAAMMENAGRGVAHAIMNWLEVAGRSVVILVGPGNNGGDGLVAGRHLAQAGAQVAFYLFKPRPADDPNLAKVAAMALPITLAEDDKGGKQLRKLVAEADVVVDALLGTGVDRPIGGGMRTLLERCSAAIEENKRRQQDRYRQPVSPKRLSFRPDGKPLVVAVDCPSGLNCDTGVLDPLSLPADLTVTFAAPKVGQVLFPGAAAIGELLVADIGSPADLPASQAVLLELATADDVRAMLPSRPLEGHKGTFGKAMVVAGSVNYAGAAALAGQAAYRAGAGLVTLAIPSSIYSAVLPVLPEATYLLLPHQMGAIADAAVSVVLEALTGYDGLLVGPGLGRDEKTRLFVRDLLAGHKKTGAKGRLGFSAVTPPESGPGGEIALPPLVVDADGLNLLSELDGWPRLLPAGSVLTPHPGEMARLLKCELGEVQADRIGSARRAADAWGQIVVLKGAFTAVAAPDGRVTLLPFANPALATAGSGDVLAGAVVALLAAGVEPYRAAVAGAFLHGMAGQKAAEECGRAGVTAGDLPLYLAAALAEWGV